MTHLKFVPFLLIGLFFNSLVAAQELEVRKQYLKEIKKLKKDKQVMTALENIDAIEPKTEADLIYLTEIPAPPFKESRRAEAFMKLLKDAGVDKVWIDEVGNVIALRKGSSGEKVVALDAHMDTVFPEETDVTVEHRGDTLVAPGIGDDTRGLAMVIAVLKSMNKAEIKTKSDLLFIGTVGEEGLGDLRGVKHLFREGGPQIDSWISIDGGSLGRVNNAGLGSVRYKVVVKGKGGHSWGAYGLGNPHHALGMIISDFNKQAIDYCADGPKTSFNVGRIGGGTSVNSIPFESWMEVDMRSVSPERLKEIEQLFLNSVNSSLEAYNGMNIKGSVELELVKIGDRPSGELPESLPLIQRAIAVSNSLGANTRLTRGSTNSNIPISKGIPAVTIGRGGRGGGAHSLHEWWLNENGADSIKMALLLTLSEAGVE